MFDREKDSELRDLSLKTDALISEFNTLPNFREYETPPRIMKSRKTAIFTEQHYEEDSPEIKIEPEPKTKRFPKRSTIYKEQELNNRNYNKNKNYDEYYEVRRSPYNNYEENREKELLRERIDRLPPKQKNEDILKYFAIFIPLFAFCFPLIFIKETMFAIGMACILAFFSTFFTVLAFKLIKISETLSWAHRQILIIHSSINEIKRDKTPKY